MLGADRRERAGAIIGVKGIELLWATTVNRET
jgi:hypothetical protein